MEFLIENFGPRGLTKSHLHIYIHTVLITVADTEEIENHFMEEIDRYTES